MRSFNRGSFHANQNVENFRGRALGATYEIIDYLISNTHSLSAQDKKRFIVSLRAFGLFKEAAEVDKGICETTPSKEGQIVSQLIADYVKRNPSLQALEVISHWEVESLKAAILIDGFDKINIPQKPLVIGIYDKLYACNYPYHLLGKNTLRSKSLKGAGYEYAGFDLKKGLEVVAKQVLDYMDHKNIIWQITQHKTTI